MTTFGDSIVRSEAARRRTFAIISHPDAGKTTLTEKLLLYSGALSEAGAVKARRGRRSATSDWMALEQQRGISITSTVLQFEHEGVVCNLLDTPGHRDFSEDTYRVLAAADAAVMVIDAAKGVERQTLKLFEVARDRGLPLLTFVNKFDRPGLEALALLDDVEGRIGVRPTPLTWPVGIAGDLRGVFDRRSGAYHRFVRTARGTTVAPEEIVDHARAADLEGPAWEKAVEELALLDAVGADHDLKRFLAGETTPVLFGSALTNFGVRMLLCAIVDLVPAPSARPGLGGEARYLDAEFAGQVFKVQANMDPAHRDRLAFVRVCSGRFERGMTVTHATTRRPFVTKYAHQLFGRERETVEVAWPGDVVGLVNATELRIGDTLFAGEPVCFPPIPSFTAEHFATARPDDVSRTKRFRRALEQLAAEGVIQMFRTDDADPVPVVGAVGPMQFDVALHRLEHEFHAPGRFERYGYAHAQRTDSSSAEVLRTLRGVRVLSRSDGARFALFESTFWVDRHRRDHPELLLDPGTATT